MKSEGILKQKNTEMEAVLKNDQCKQILEKYCKEDLGQTTSLIIVYEIQNGEKRETYWKCAGMEPAQAILSLDQLHHRIQHEGLADYD